MIHWFYGQPGSGKTTLAKAMISNSPQLEFKKYIHIDGDEMRDIFNNKDYSKEGRLNNLRNVNNIARFLEYKGYDVFVSVVAPYNDIRDELRDLDINYYYVHTTETRGREDYFASDFEFNDSDIKINTTNKSVTQSLNEVFTIHR